MASLCITIGSLVTGSLADSALVRWDRQVPVDLEQARTATGEIWSSYGSMLGETLTVISVAVLVGLALLVLRRWGSVLLLATALLCEVTVFVATTFVVPRNRPDVDQLDVSPPTSSFPSGHTAAATALAFSLALIVTWHVRSVFLRVVVWVLACCVGPVVGFSRMYRGMHHPIDVAVGFGLGAACVVVAVIAVRAWAGAEPSAGADDQHESQAHDAVQRHVAPLQRRVAS